jgi:hypothetical protein
MTAQEYQMSNRIFDQFQFNEVLRAREQAEIHQRAEVELLDNTDYRDYCARREAQQTQLVEPDIPQDEMNFSDYRKSRNAQENK